MNDGSEAPGEVPRNGYFALSGFGRVNLTMRPSFAYGDESADRLAILPFELNAFASKGANFVGAKSSIRHECECGAVGFDGAFDNPIDLFVAGNFENLLTDGFEPRQVPRLVVDISASFGESQYGA